MKRTGLSLLCAMLLLLGLASCRLPFSGGSGDQLATLNSQMTLLAQTLTALASTPTVTPTASPTPTLPDQSPQEFIYYYFDNINLRNYSLTWSLLTDAFKNRVGSPGQDGYQAYITFWNTVQKVTVKGAFYTCLNQVCSVNAILELDYVDGEVTSDTYPYTLTRDESRDTWVFDYRPSPTGTATRTRIPTNTTTRTRTATTTRTGTATLTRTATATPTRTGTATFTGTATSTATRTSTGTLTRTPTSTLTRTPTATGTGTQTLTPTPSFTPTLTLTPTASQTPSVTPSLTASLTPSETPAPGETPTDTPTETPTNP